MPERDYTEQMKTAIERIVSDDAPEDFEEQWSFVENLLGDLSVRGFYAVNDDDYVNVAILTDKSIIDVEVSEDTVRPVNISITLINSIAEVRFSRGPIQTIADSEDSQLTVVLSLIGATDTGQYWWAEDDDEERRLTRFGAALMQVINRS
jgi:hypothetical protein